nr:MAG TPA: hypothetical protein [Caudoviricetes sp.]
MQIAFLNPSKSTSLTVSDSRRLGVLILFYKVNKINGLRIFQMVKYRYLILSFAALGAVFFYAIFAAAISYVP